MAQDNLAKLLSDLNELGEKLGKVRADISDADEELLKQLTQAASIDWTSTELILVAHGKRGKPLAEMLLYYGLVHLVHVCVYVAKNSEAAESLARTLGNAAQRAVHHYKGKQE